jgi:hypothetical protein
MSLTGTPRCEAIAFEEDSPDSKLKMCAAGAGVDAHKVDLVRPSQEGASAPTRTFGLTCSSGFQQTGGSKVVWEEEEEEEISPGSQLE